MRCARSPRLLLMCDPRDLGVALTEDISGGLKIFEPNLYLFDSYPGGVGLSAPLHKMTRRLLAGAAEMLAGCPCEAGCPSCVGPVGEVGERGKEVAAANPGGTTPLRLGLPALI